MIVVFNVHFNFYLLFDCAEYYLGHRGSLIFAGTCRIQFPDQGSNLGPCIGSSESQPLDHQGSVIFKFQICNLSEYIWDSSRLLPVATGSFLNTHTHTHTHTQILMCVLCPVAQSCPTLCDPVDYCPPGSSVHGILQARVLDWVAISFSRGSSRPRGRTWVSCIESRLFTIWATREVNYGEWGHKWNDLHSFLCGLLSDIHAK